MPPQALLDAFRWVSLEDPGMNLLQSICCLFGSRCILEEVKQTGGATRPSGPADLGQTEAQLEKAGKEQMGHMEGGDPSNNRDDQEARGRSPRTPRR